MINSQRFVKVNICCYITTVIAYVGTHTRGPHSRRLYLKEKFVVPLASVGENSVSFYQKLGGY